MEHIADGFAQGAIEYKAQRAVLGIVLGEEEDGTFEIGISERGVGEDERATQVKDRALRIIFVGAEIFIGHRSMKTWHFHRYFARVKYVEDY